MNPPALTKLARDINLDDAAMFRLRLSFGIACIERVGHLLTEPAIIDCLATGKAYLAGQCSDSALRTAAAEASRLARSHPGSNGLDGSGNAAVSTSFGVAAALVGKALVAAEYAAYASVYAYASHAVTDARAYDSEHNWQIARLKALSGLEPD